MFHFEIPQQNLSLPVLSARLLVLAVTFFLFGCGRFNPGLQNDSSVALGGAPVVPVPSPTPDPTRGPGSSKVPSLSDLMSEASQSNILKLLQEITGTVPATVNGSTVLLNERYSAVGKRNWRAYWKQYYIRLGIPVTETTFPTQHGFGPGETEGHNLEAVLPGKVADSIVIIVHYDSVGIPGQNLDNPGVDDCMTGMAIQMETARVFAAHKNNLHYTVRFVASDYEEWASPGLEGAREYAKALKALAFQNKFKVVAGIDAEQSGWNCFTEGLCGDNTKGDTFDIFTCATDNSSLNFPSIAVDFKNKIEPLGALQSKQGCIGQNSDNYALWEIGVPTIVISEHNPFANPHFDQEGGDTYDKIDQNYYFKIAKMAIAYAGLIVLLE